MDNLDQSKDFVFKGAEGEKPMRKKQISLIILTTRLEAKQDKAPTVRKMTEKSESMGFKCIITDCP